MIEPLTLSVLALLAVASVSDVTQHRIPNALVVGVAGVSLAQAAVRGGFVALGSSLLAIVVVGALIWPAWTRRWIGGGDLKLAAATGAWLGVTSVPTFLVASSVTIGVMSLASYALSARATRADVRRNLVFAARGVAFTAPLGSQAGRAQVPAGAGFAVGAIVTLVLSGGLR
jgi:prepilin peptidase CpaA